MWMSLLKTQKVTSHDSSAILVCCVDTSGKALKAWKSNQICAL